MRSSVASFARHVPPLQKGVPMSEFSTMTDGLRKMFLAGVGAIAAVGEKGGDIVETLAERGEAVVNQGKQLNRELTQKGVAATSGLREDALRGMMAVMSAEERAEFADAARRMADEYAARDAAKGDGPVTAPVDAPAPETPASETPACGCGSA